MLPAIDTSVSRAEAEALVDLAAGKVVLEVGSWWGFSTVAMALVASTVHAVDWHLGDDHAGHDASLGQLIANLDRYGVRDRVVVYVGDAATVLPFLRPATFDLAFIDAFHETDAVRRDIAGVLPLMRSGATVAFHDYGRFGVAAAVDELGLPIDLVETLAVVRLP
jgi:predicted O-methyltransferase YrrM